MLSRLLVNDVDDGIGSIDPIVDSWRERLIRQKKKIWWESHYQMDLDARRNADVPEEVDDVPVPSILSLQAAMYKGFEKIGEKLVEMDTKINALDMRVKGLDNYVTVQKEKELEKARCEDMYPGSPTDFVPNVYQSTHRQSMALVIHSGVADPKPPIIQPLCE